MASSILPSWVTDMIPADENPATISWNEETKSFSSSTGETSDNLVDLYDHLEEDHTIIFDSTVQGHQGTLIGDIVISNVPTNNGYRILLGGGREETIRYLEDSWREFMTVINPYYESNPDNLISSVMFLDRHPALWLYDDETGNWRTDGYVDDIKMDILLKPAGYFHRIEFGTQCVDNGESMYRIHYFDPRLTARGYSYKEVIIDAARNLHAHYHSDGTERED